MGRYFITGGGTGGHIYPAIAVANALFDDEIFYIGNPKNLEYDVVKKKGFKFLPVCVSAMPRTLSLRLIKFLWQLFVSILKCCYYILHYKPDAIFGTGGYVSAPALIAANILKVPYMMHDCDAQPGIVSRKLSFSAKYISVAFESACKFLNNKNCFVNGNPIRIEFQVLSKETARNNLNLQDKLTLCIMGGSQGARSINDASVMILKKLFENYDIQIIFQTGKKNYERVIEQLIRVYPEYGSNSNLLVQPYFDDMIYPLKAADIVVSRAGSLILSEINICGLPAILVPYPHAAADHQRKNAKEAEKAGYAVWCDDSQFDGQELQRILYSLLQYLINVVCPIYILNRHEIRKLRDHYNHRNSFRIIQMISFCLNYNFLECFYLYDI